MSSGVQQGVEEGTDTGLKRTEIHDVLRNDRRRLVLSRLREAEDPVSVRDLSEYIAGVEADEMPAPRNVRQSVYVSLHQTHLPKLEELGVVDYDGDTKAVTLADAIDDVTVYMEVVPENDLSWAEYYLGLGVLGLLLVAAHSLGVPTVSAVDVRLWTTGVLLALVVSAAYQFAAQSPSLTERLSNLR
jgi:predicted transcriptional regulator